MIVRTKHIHSYDFHSSSDDSIVTEKVISDDSLYSALKNSENIKLVKVLSNETHLHFPIETATPLTYLNVPGHNLRHMAKIMLKVKTIEFSYVS